MKSTIYLTLFICLLLQLACVKDQTELIIPDELTDIDQIRTYLRQAVADNNLIIGLDSTSNRDIPYCELQMEDESVVFFKKKWLDQAVSNPADWRMHFAFTDNSQETALYLGDTIFWQEDSIRVNPSGEAPLTAIVPSSMPLKGRFGVKVFGKTPDGISIEGTLSEFGEGQVIPILGLYPNYNNTVEITFLSPQGKVRARRQLQLQTGTVSSLPGLNITQNQLPADDDGIFFLSDGRQGFDQRGETRWIYTGDARYLFRKLQNGNLVVATATGVIRYHSVAFEEINMLGETIRRYEVPNLMHHEVREMPNGNFLVASNSELYTGSNWDGKGEEDYIVEIDRESGEVVKSWNLNDILDNQRPRADGVENDDWLHLNGLYFNEADNSIVLSSRHQSLLAKIDYETGDLRWILAHPAGWGAEWLPYILQPVHTDGSPVDLANVDFLPYFLHAPAPLPDGSIAVYDNGNYRNFYEDPSVPQISYSRAVAYQIDEAAGTVQLAWQFDYEQSIFTIATGDIDYFDHNQHRLIGFLNSGSNSPKIVELDANDEIVFEADFNLGSYYRCEKISLYDGL